MTSTSAAPFSLELPSDHDAEVRLGTTVVGLALTCRWLVAVLLLGAGTMAGGLDAIGLERWLALVGARAFLDAALAAVTTAGAFAMTRQEAGRLDVAGLGLRLLALSDFALATSWALEGPTLLFESSAHLVALGALVHASFAYAVLRRLARACDERGEHGAAAFTRASGWAFVVAAVLALGTATPAAWVTLGLTVPVTNPALPAVLVVALYATLRARVP